MLLGQMVSGLFEAFKLIIEGDPEIYTIIFLSLRVSGIALFIATAAGVPLGAWLGLTGFPGRRLVVALVYTGMGLPPVVVGLVVFMLLSTTGPLGSLGWLFKVPGMILAQSIIALPIVAGLTMSAVGGVNKNVKQQLVALGASPAQVRWATLSEARMGVIAAVLAGFGRIVAEVGAVMLVGGNIQYRTRVLTTAIVLETRKGNFGMALALGIILLIISFFVNAAVLRLHRKELGES